MYRTFSLLASAIQFLMLNIAKKKTVIVIFRQDSLVLAAAQFCERSHFMQET